MKSGSPRGIEKKLEQRVLGLFYHRNIAINNLRMGVTQVHLFTEEQNKMAQLAKAIAHPARIAILEHMIKTKSCINGDLVLEIGLAQATISQHLRELKEAGIIQGTIEGNRVNYCIHPENWNEIRTIFHSFFDSFSNCTSPKCI